MDDKGKPGHVLLLIQDCNARLQLRARYQVQVIVLCDLVWRTVYEADKDGLYDVCAHKGMLVAQRWRDGNQRFHAPLLQILHIPG